MHVAEHWVPPTRFTTRRLPLAHCADRKGSYPNQRQYKENNCSNADDGVGLREQDQRGHKHSSADQWVDPDQPKDN